MTEKGLFSILDGISDGVEFLNDRRASELKTQLKDLDSVIAYAKGELGISIADYQAQRISEVGVAWIDRVRSGNGDWGRFRDHAKANVEKPFFRLGDLVNGGFGAIYDSYDDALSALEEVVTETNHVNALRREGLGDEHLEDSSTDDAVDLYIILTASEDGGWEEVVDSLKEKSALDGGIECAP